MTENYLPGALRYILRRHQDQISTAMTNALENAIEIAEKETGKDDVD